jgi:DNA-binding NarL/FixJ family response regulator
MIRVLFIDDSLIFRKALRRFFATQPQVCLVGESNGREDILKLVATLQPDIVITDLEMPTRSGLSVIAQLREYFPVVGCIALTLHHTNGYRQAALQAGAHAFVVKSSLRDNLMLAIHDTMRLLREKQCLNNDC